MEQGVLGVHHVTAIAGDPQQNLDFYAGILGMRLVKVTINYDDPTTYHFYYGDEHGRPGTILTFFPWPRGFRGQRGVSQATTISLSVPERSMGFWQERLRAHGVEVESITSRFEEDVLAFTDPDGLSLELVAQAGADARSPWAEGPVPGEMGIRSVHSVTLSEEGYEQTAELLTDTLGFRAAGEKGNRFRFQVGGPGDVSTVDVLCLPSAPQGTVAVGTVHHVAWRTPNYETQREWRRELVDLGLNVSPVMDRQYFQSIYFREPGGILFEIATDPPGFTADEAPEALGTSLRLPGWLEPARRDIERHLAPVALPSREGRVV